MSDPSPVADADQLEPGDYDAIFVSPHLDDVALSCAGAVQRHRADGRRVLTAVAFSHAGPDAEADERDHYAARRAEERRAAVEAGYDVLWGGFVDAPFRDPPHRSFNAIVWGVGACDDEIVGQLTEWLGELVGAARPDQLVGPLGVGRHIDHRLVFEATRRLAHRFDELDVWHYEDRPYALVDQAVDMRLLELCAGAHVDFDAFWESFVDAPYVQRHLDAEQRRDCRKRFAALYDEQARGGDTSNKEATSRLIAAPDGDSIWRTVAHYDSQIEAFIGSIESYRRACRRYARRIQPDAVYLERQWRL
jgi:LmbE family N-acetylglucosaminyl deacetylase